MIARLRNHFNQTVCSSCSPVMLKLLKVNKNQEYTLVVKLGSIHD